MSFTVPTLLSDERMRDIVITGFESGSYGSFIVRAYEGPIYPPAWGREPEWTYPRYAWQWAEGAIRVTDRYGDKKQGTISRRTLQRGLKILAEKYPRLLAQLVDESYDVIAADALLQAAAFGEVIYG